MSRMLCCSREAVSAGVYQLLHVCSTPQDHEPFLSNPACAVPALARLDQQ